MTDRERSVWGWGYVEEHPDDDTIRELADRLETDFGFPDLTVEGPTGVDEIAVPEPDIDPPNDLADFCTGTSEVRAHHTYGDAYRDKIRAFRGDFAPAPDVVARPTTEEQIEELLAWASDRGVAVIPFGGGTSVVGGVEGDVNGDYAGVVSLDLREMNRVLEVDEVSRSARIQGGTLGPQIQDQLAEYDLQLRHYPQSYEFSTLGGWLATHSGGHFATQYTHIDDFVENVRMITPAGTLETRRVPASGAGPDTNHFVLGSEGALGVITEAWMSVQPRPEYRSRATVHFDDFDAAVAATRHIAQARLAPANCRLLDAAEAALYQLTDEGDDSHLLFLGFESIDHPTKNDLERALDICEDHGGTCPRGAIHGDRDAAVDTPEERWRRAFIEAPYLWDGYVRLGVIFDTFETAVTWEGFPALDAAIREEVTAAMERACGMGHLSLRFTHVYPEGPAPYYTFVAPAERGRELEQWREIKSTASDVLLEHGATITHHHAVGRVHQDWYARETEDFQESLRAVKRVLDPAGIMNPGVLVE